MKSKILFSLALLSLLACAGTGRAQSGIPAVASTFDVGHGLSATLERGFYASRHSGLERYNGSEVTSFSLHRKFSAGTLHYGNTYAPAERHQHVGLSSGRFTGAYFQGGGVSFSKAGNGLYSDLNHYFFHGGNHAPFRFQGGALDVDAGGGVSAQIAGVRIKSPGLEDRSGHFAGVSAGRVSGGLFGLRRGGQGVGHGFNFAFAGERVGLEYQEIRSDTGAHLRRVGFSWRSGAAARFSLELEDASNPLYAASDERRVMFRFQRPFGSGASLHATEQEGGAEDDAGGQDRYTKIVAVGLGVGALAAVVSSGDGDSDGSQRFATADEAAFDVVNRINPVSVRENREHGGWIYRQADGSFNSTNPVPGDVASVNIGNPVTSVPAGTVAAASYHTHGGPDPRYDNENFSPQDILSDSLAGVDGYLGTPAGFLKKHILRTNQVVVLGRVAN